MKQFVRTLLITIFFYAAFSNGMEVPAQTDQTQKAQSLPTALISHDQNPLWLPQEIIAHIAGYCQPPEKDILMKLCKDFYACLHDKELILLANPLTVTLSHKRKKMFEYIRSGDANKLSIWLSVLSAKDINDQATYYPSTRSPLHIAIKNNDTNSIRLLIKYGADVNQRSIFEFTPLYVASDEGHTKAVQLLLTADDININKTVFGSAPLYVASQQGHTEIVKLLLTAGADVNQADADGWTPLYIASYHGYIEIVKALLAHKANFTTVQQGNIELTIAKNNGHTQVVKLLEAELRKETEK